MAIFKSKIPIYRMSVVYTDCADTFNSQTGCELSDTYSAGGVYRYESTVYIYLPFSIDTGFEITDLAHESFHAADFVSEWAGLEYKEKSGNEHVAYLISFFSGYILECGDKILKKASNNG